MNYPSINKQPRREINRPELSGGANYRDSISNVLDNQLTDCLNVWYMDGALRTRPNFKTNLNMKLQNTRITSVEQSIGFKVFPEITKDGAVLVSYTELEGSAMDYDKYYQYVYLWWQKEDSIEPLATAYITEVDWAKKFFIVEKDGALYCLFGNGEIQKLEYTKDNAEWVKLDGEDIYSPLVYTHCLRTDKTYITRYTSSAFEGYNLINNSYRVIYSTVNPALITEENPTVRMEYSIPGWQNFESLKLKKVTAKYFNGNKTFIHETNSTNSDGTYLTESDFAEDGLMMYASEKVVRFWSESEQIHTLSTHYEDNLEITVYYENTPNNKVFGMTQSVWFGGSANGLSDGSRLFLCGNTNENEQALVVWSGLNDPTYFPENNYAYVGNKAQPTVAFGKQDDKLVIFKPNDTYYTYYAQNTEITADDLINQTVVDYQANSVYFPMVQLNGSIGCDLPDTVQLCRNRLVWANSNGKVYTLVSTNQYSEMSMYEVSAMVERKIKSGNDFRYFAEKGHACDFNGYYMLIFGTNAYLMDYNSYGYQYVYSYTKTEDAQLKIPWYCWEIDGTEHVCFGENITSFHFLNGEDAQHRWLTATVLSSDNTDGDDQCLALEPYTLGNEEEIYIETTPIKSSLTTKLFDFGAPHYRKNVDRVSIAFGNNGGAPITVRFVTDVGIEEESVSLSGDELTAYTPAYVTVKQFNPCIRAHTRFGIQIECEGLLAVDAVNLLYRLLGGVR